MQDLVKNLDQLDVLLPQMLAQFPPMIATMQSARNDDADDAQHDVGHLRTDGRSER